MYGGRASKNVAFKIIVLADFSIIFSDIFTKAIKYDKICKKN